MVVELEKAVLLELFCVAVIKDVQVLLNRIMGPNGNSLFLYSKLDSSNEIAGKIKMIKFLKAI